MKVTVERLKDTEVEGDKRQYAPYITKWTCPDCGTENKEDHADRNYFSYPIFGKPKAFTLHCPTCDDQNRSAEKGTVMLTLDAVVTAGDDAVVVVPRTEALLCIDTLRRQAKVFEEHKNEGAANALRLVAERLYEATHSIPPAPPPPKTRYDLLGGDDE